MRVERILRELCGRWVDGVHAVRLKAVLAVVQGIIVAGRISVLAIGRALEGTTSPKHSIKRVDRLLSNGKMLRERWSYFAAAAHRLIRCATPVLLVDWTQVAEGFHALVAAIPAGGRALAVYLEVHPECDLGNSRVQAKFLKNLRKVLPAGCRPVLITDAGFHGPFFREILALGWNFVGRLRTNARMKPAGSETWLDMRALLERASSRARDLGAFRLYRTKRKLDARLVLGARRPRKARRKWSRSSRRGGVHASVIKGAREPWLLATSLKVSASRVVALYQQRMQIEQIFRDVKNPRFGWCMRHLRARSAARLTVLLLLVVLALLAMLLVGCAAEAAGKARQYQANTQRKRTLSLFVLALAVVRRGDTTGLRERIPIALAALQATTALGHPTA
jgi:hypothetical protein